MTLASTFAAAIRDADLTDDDVLALAQPPATYSEVAEKVAARAGVNVTALHARAWLFAHDVATCGYQYGRGECEEPGTEIRRGVIRCPQHDRSLT